MPLLWMLYGTTYAPIAPVSRLPIEAESSRAPKHMVQKLQEYIRTHSKPRRPYPKPKFI